MTKKRDRNEETFKQVKVDPVKEQHDGYSNEPNVAPANYDKVETDGTTLTSKTEKNNNHRGSTYQGNPTDPFENHVQDVVEKTKTPKKEKANKSTGKLNDKKIPEPTPDLEETSNREDG